MRRDGFGRVLFCIPPDQMRIPRALKPHSGVGCLSEFLSKHGIETAVFDFRLGHTLKDLYARIREFEPDLIGFTMVSYGYHLFYDIVKQTQNLKNKEKLDYKIVIGGPHVSTIRSQVLKECEADFAVKLEGEFTLLELCQGTDPSYIKGLIYREGDKIVENDDRAFIKNLDEVPFPTHEKIELKRYARQIPIVTSRGCPFRCIFCPIRVTMGRVWRARSAENVVEEIKYWYDRGYRYFDIDDDNFTLDKNRVYKICDMIEGANLRGLTLTTENGIRADLVDKSLLKRMREVGFQEIAFGIEAGNDKVLQRIKKGMSTKKIEESIRDACELGFDVGLFFMVGHPGETQSDVEDSFRLALKYPVSYVFFYNIIPFLGTELHDFLKSNNYLLIDPKEYLGKIAHFENVPIFETPELPAKERRELLKKAKKIETRIRKKTLKTYVARSYGALGKTLIRAPFFIPLLDLTLQKSAENALLRKIIVKVRDYLGPKRSEIWKSRRRFKKGYTCAQ